MNEMSVQITSILKTNKGDFLIELPLNQNDLDSLLTQAGIPTADKSGYELLDTYGEMEYADECLKKSDDIEELNCFAARFNSMDRIDREVFSRVIEAKIQSGSELTMKDLINYTFFAQDFNNGDGNINSLYELGKYDLGEVDSGDTTFYEEHGKKVMEQQKGVFTKEG